MSLCVYSPLYNRRLCHCVLTHLSKQETVSLCVNAPLYNPRQCHYMFTHLSITRDRATMCFSVSLQPERCNYVFTVLTSLLFYKRRQYHYVFTHLFTIRYYVTVCLSTFLAESSTSLCFYSPLNQRQYFRSTALFVPVWTIWETSTPFFIFIRATTVKAMLL